jgi:hypothetical protein
MNKTYRAVKDKYSWLNMRQEIEGYVKQSKSCQVNKILRPRGKVPMEITTSSHQPLEKCYIDIVGPLTDSREISIYLLSRTNSANF